MYHHPSCEECREGRSIDVNHTSQLESFICSGFRFRFRFRIPVPFPDSRFPGFHTPLFFGGVTQKPEIRLCSQAYELWANSEIFICSWESTLPNIAGLSVNFTVLYVILIDLHVIGSPEQLGRIK